MNRDDDGFVVEQPVSGVNAHGSMQAGVGTARVWCGSQARAEQIVREGAEATPPVARTWRRVPLTEMPQAARENLLRARAEAAAATV